MDRVTRLERRLVQAKLERAYIEADLAELRGIVGTNPMTTRERILRTQLTTQIVRCLTIESGINFELAKLRTAA